ncbi:MAG: HEPN domain-containing protein [Thermodesulfobacteriota bacterium]
MDLKRRNRIRAEMKKADDYLLSAEILHKQGLYAPSVTVAYHCACHAAVAAFLTSGSTAMHKGPVASMTAIAVKFSDKLDPFIEKLNEARSELKMSPSLDYLENDALLRLYQTKEFFLEVKDFLRRVIRY